MGRAFENEGPHEARPAGVGAHAPSERLREAIDDYEYNPCPAALDRAFAVAAAAVASLRGAHAREGADAVEARRLMEELPEFDRLVSIAVEEAEHAALAGACRLWEWFGLRSIPPTWNEGERSKPRSTGSTHSSSTPSPRPVTSLHGVFAPMGLATPPRR